MADLWSVQLDIKELKEQVNDLECRFKQLDAHYQFRMNRIARGFEVLSDWWQRKTGASVEWHAFQNIKEDLFRAIEKE